MPTKSKPRTTTKCTKAGRPLVQRRLPTERRPTHPGEMLLEEFLEPLGISQSAFAIRLGVSFPRLNEIDRQAHPAPTRRLTPAHTPTTTLSETRNATSESVARLCRIVADHR